VNVMGFDMHLQLDMRLTCLWTVELSYLGVVLRRPIPSPIADEPETADA